MNNYSSLITIALFALLFIFPLLIYLNLRKYKTAALSLLFSKKPQTIRTFQFFAVAMIVYAISAVIRTMNDIYNISYLFMVYLAISILLTIFLVYVFYRLYWIMRV